MLPHQPQVKAPEQIITSVTSTATKYRSHGRIEEGGMQIFKPGLRGSGKVVMSLAQRMSPHPGQKTKSGERFDSLSQPVRLGIARWGNHGDFCPLAHCGNTQFADLQTSPCLSEADKLRRSGQANFRTGSPPFDGLRSPWGDHAQQR